MDDAHLTAVYLMPKTVAPKLLTSACGQRWMIACDCGCMDDMCLTAVYLRPRTVAIILVLSVSWSQRCTNTCSCFVWMTHVAMQCNLGLKLLPQLWCHHGVKDERVVVVIAGWMTCVSLRYNLGLKLLPQVWGHPRHGVKDG